MGLFAARMADAATSVMTHICAIFFISFFLSSNFDLPCRLYYEVRAGLDEIFAGFFDPGKTAKGDANADPVEGFLEAGSIACYHFRIAAVLFCQIVGRYSCACFNGISSGLPHSLSLCGPRRALSYLPGI